MFWHMRSSVIFCLMLMLSICISWIFAHSVFMQVSQGTPGSYSEDGAFSLSISVVQLSWLMETILLQGHPGP